MFIWSSDQWDIVVHFMERHLPHLFGNLCSLSNPLVSLCLCAGRVSGHCVKNGKLYSRLAGTISGSNVRMWFSSASYAYKRLGLGKHTACPDSVHTQIQLQVWKIAMSRVTWQFVHYRFTWPASGVKRRHLTWIHISFKMRKDCDDTYME